MKSKNKTIEHRSEFVKNLDAIYKDLLAIKINQTDSFKSSMDKFYAVMRKWGICQGTWSGNGRAIATAEWNMCFMVFKAHRNGYMDLWQCISTPPKDLLAYGKKPEKNAYDRASEKKPKLISTGKPNGTKCESTGLKGLLKSKRLKEKLKPEKCDYVRASTQNPISKAVIKKATPLLNKKNQQIMDVFISGICKKLTTKTSPDYPNSVFYMDGNTVMLEHDQENNYLWVQFDIWAVFTDRFLMDYNQTQAITKTLLEKHLKLKVAVTKMIPAMLQRSMEKHIALHGITIKRKNHAGKSR